MTATAIVLKGGLGNQLFQWALAKRFAHLGRRVILDPRLVHRVEIQPLLGQIQLSALPSCGLRVGRKLGINRSVTNYRWIDERNFNYWDGVFLQTGRILCEGYWQAPRYFGPIREEVREDIREWGSGCLTPAGIRWAEHNIGAGSTASVHVRKGDYVSSAAARAHHGVLPNAYFIQAMAELSRAGIEHFAVFCDDLAVARQMFGERSDCARLLVGVVDAPDRGLPDAGVQRATAGPGIRSRVRTWIRVRNASRIALVGRGSAATDR